MTQSSKKAEKVNGKKPVEKQYWATDEILERLNQERKEICNYIVENFKVLTDSNNFIEIDKPYGKQYCYYCNDYLNKVRTFEDQGLKIKFYYCKDIEFAKKLYCYWMNYYSVLNFYAEISFFSFEEMLEKDSFLYLILSPEFINSKVSEKYE